jgi:uncharacterized RDD family membrane protein YckC
MAGQCQSCESTLPAGARFCPACGRTVTSTEPTGPAPQPLEGVSATVSGQLSSENGSGWSCTACGHTLPDYATARRHADTDHPELAIASARAALRQTPSAAHAPQGVPASAPTLAPTPSAHSYQQPRFASWGYRLGAFVVDVSLAAVAALGIGALARASGASEADASLIVGTIVLLGWPVYVSAAMVVLKGRTVGKAIAAIRVERADGRPAGAGRGLLRELARGLLIVVPFAEIVDHLWPLWDDGKQSLHDKMVRTFVVRGEGYERRAVTLTLAALAGVGAWVALSASGPLY